MILSRTKPAVLTTYENDQAGKGLPSMDQFLSKRDYTAAITMLEFEKSSGTANVMTDRWLGYANFHLGDYKKAMQIYENLLKTSSPPPDVHQNLACCYFFLGMYEQAEKALDAAPSSSLKTRLQFHLSHKMGDEERLMNFHKQLENVTEDMLSLAAVHYLRSHYQESVDIYKRILLDNREYVALNVYVALCYYKLDYYDVSQEILSSYLQKYPDSAIALNLKACNHFRLYNGKAAEAELQTLLDQGSSTFIFGNDLIKHNQVVFKNGQGALQILPTLVDVISEARLNLVIYHCKQGSYKDAYDLVETLEPSVPQEYILKGIVNLVIGQELGSRDNLKVAQTCFHMVGNSASEADTIPGRQCMASSFFLQRQFEDVHVYLSSIKSYFFNDDYFNFNYAQVKCALGNFKEAEEIFLNIQNEKFKEDYVYISHLARCYVMNGKPELAWEMYIRMETSAESFTLLQLLANDCYKMGHFYQAAKALDLLERLDPTPEHWEGKRGACVGTFQLIIAGKLSNEILSDLIQLLRNSSNPQVESIIRIVKKWAKENRINI